MHSFIFFTNDVQTSVAFAESVTRIKSDLNSLFYTAKSEKGFQLHFFLLHTNLPPFSSTPRVPLSRQCKSHFPRQCHFEREKQLQTAGKRRAQFSSFLWIFDSSLCCDASCTKLKRKLMWISWGCWAKWFKCRETSFGLSYHVCCEIAVKWEKQKAKLISWRFPSITVELEKL